MRFRQLLLELNVINIDDIQAQLQSYAERCHSDWAKQWFTSKKIRNYFINSEDHAVKVTNVPADAPDWMKKAKESGDELYQIEFDPETVTKLDHIVDWLNDLHSRSEIVPNPQQGNTQAQKQRKQEAIKELKNLQKVTLEQAIEKADKWTESLSREAKKIKDYGEGEKEVYNFGEGFTMVKLSSENACKREGDLMNNCLGGLNYGTRVESGEIQLYSLRDENNEPRVSIDVRPETDEPYKINEIKGRGNKPPVGKYVAMIQEWLNSLKPVPVPTSRGRSDFTNMGLFFNKDKNKYGSVREVGEKMEPTTNCNIFKVETETQYSTNRMSYYFFKKNTPNRVLKIDTRERDEDSEDNKLAVEVSSFLDDDETLGPYLTDAKEFLNREAFRTSSYSSGFMKYNLLHQNGKWGDLIEVGDKILTIKDKTWLKFQSTTYLVDNKDRSIQVTINPGSGERGYRRYAINSIKLKNRSLENVAKEYLIPFLNAANITNEDVYTEQMTQLKSMGVLWHNKESTWRHISEAKEAFAELRNGNVYKIGKTYSFTNKNGIALFSMKIERNQQDVFDEIVIPQTTHVKQTAPYLEEFFRKKPEFTFDSNAFGSTIVDLQKGWREEGYFVRDKQLKKVSDYFSSDPVIKTSEGNWYKELNADNGETVLAFYKKNEDDWFMRIDTNEHINYLRGVRGKKSDGGAIGISTDAVSENDSYRKALLAAFKEYPDLIPGGPILIRAGFYFDGTELKMISNSSPDSIKAARAGVLKVSPEFYMVRTAKDRTTNWRSIGVEAWTLTKDKNLEPYSTYLFRDNKDSYAIVTIASSGDIDEVRFKKELIKRSEAWKNISNFLSVILDTYDHE